MYDRPFQETNPPFQPNWDPTPHRRQHGYGIVHTVVKWTAIALIAMLALGTATWAFGLLFHLAALLLRVALVTAVVAFVWRRITRRRPRSYDL
jgi:hypothetical protein